MEWPQSPQCVPQSLTSSYRVILAGVIKVLCLISAKSLYQSLLQNNRWWWNRWGRLNPQNHSKDTMQHKIKILEVICLIHT
ncbi:hypothetical protein GOBAR_AA32607 [Gossypium barbadense]|uniref:Uncharacterized protein n=1 Tax=Gossypium barbadense TaxID=3634 RepID=A0A2P5WAF3_GOSBA|nr:hypothetical protein GOBAR_AA32607 [Gossypium barbadense]